MKIDWTQYNDDKEITSAVNLCRAIRCLKYEALIVGGFARDLIFDTKSNDIDIATNMPMEELKKVFRTYDVNGAKHGTLLVKFNDYTFEVTQYRTEASYSDGRRPDHVYFVSNFKKDAERRDFTINAIGIDVDGNVIDHVNAEADFDSNILRAVGDPSERFQEDSLRILRAVRFAVKYKLQIDKETSKAIIDNAYRVSSLSMERVMDELSKMAKLGGKKFSFCIKLLQEYKVWDVLFDHIKVTESSHSALCNVKSNDLVVLFAVLTFVQDVDLVSMKCSRRFDSDVKFVINHLLVYADLPHLSLYVGYKLVTSHLFGKVREAYVALNDNVDVDNVDAAIERLLALSGITRFSKVIHQAMNQMGIGKTHYSKVSKQLQEWAMEMMEKDVELDELDVTLRIVNNHVDAVENPSVLQSYTV